jgi:uncharacterized UBP type Zn finger protein
MVQQHFAGEGMFVDNDNGYACSSCKDYTDATRTQILTGAAPASIMLQLSRFEFNSRTKEASKIHAEVTDLDFLSLDFESSERTRTREHYSLHAIIDHVGASQRSGHYISYARRIDQHKQPGEAGRLEWFKLDDSVFTQMTRAEVLSSSRYNF